MRITEYGLKINAHMEKGNTHYGMRYTVYGLLNTRTWKASFTLTTLKYVCINLGDQRVC